MNACICCRASAATDRLCLSCLRLFSAVLLLEDREVVAAFWNVSDQFESARATATASFRHGPNELEAAMGCAIGLVRTGKIDHGLCLAASCVATDASACWACIAPGDVFVDPNAIRLDRLSELRQFLATFDGAPNIPLLKPT